MNMGSKEKNDPNNFSQKDQKTMNASRAIFEPKKKRKVLETKMSAGEKGGFVQESQGPVTGGVVNTLDEVIMTNVLDSNKKQKSSKQTKKPKVVYKSKVGKVIGDVFGKKKNKYGQTIVRKSSNSSLL